MEDDKTSADRMTKTERAELKSLVRRRFKQLRNDVDTRVLEMTAEAALDRIDPESPEAHARQEFELYVARRIQDCRSDISDEFDRLLGEFPLSKLSGVSGMSAHPTELVVGRFAGWDKSLEREMMIAGKKTAEAAGKAAKATLERQEVDMLERLTLDGLETDAAKDFLSSIPAIGELIPTSSMPCLDH